MLSPSSFSQPPLFQSPADLEAQHAAAWHRWAVSVQRAGDLARDSSLSVYRHMWQGFSDWLIRHQVAPQAIASGHLTLYLDERGKSQEVTARYAWRLVRLVDRILQYNAALDGVMASSACAEFLERRPDIRFANASQQDGLPEALSAAQTIAVLRWLRQDDGEDQTLGTRWKHQRLRCAVALHLGAGVTPGELRSLELRHIHRQTGLEDASGGGRPSGLLLPANGNSPAHRIPLDGWLATLLGQWLGLRAQLGFPGQAAFPATKSSGAPWGKVAHYEAIRKALVEAGVPEDKGGASYRLRHTYALRQLRRGVSPAELAQRLGVTDPDVVERYRRLLAKRAESQEEEVENSYTADFDAW